MNSSLCLIKNFLLFNIFVSALNHDPDKVKDWNNARKRDNKQKTNSETKAQFRNKSLKIELASRWLDTVVEKKPACKKENIVVVSK